MKPINFNLLYHHVLGVLREHVGAPEVLRTMEIGASDVEITVTPESLKITLNNAGVVSTHLWKSQEPDTQAEYLQVEREHPVYGAARGAFGAMPENRMSRKAWHPADGVFNRGADSAFPGQPWAAMHEPFRPSYGPYGPQYGNWNSEPPRPFGAAAYGPPGGFSSLDADLKLSKNLGLYAQQHGLAPQMIQAAISCMFIGLPPQLAWLKNMRLRAVFPSLPQVGRPETYAHKAYYDRLDSLDSQLATFYSIWLQDAPNLLFPIMMDRAANVAYLCMCLALGVLPGQGAPNDRRGAEHDWMHGDHRLQERQQWTHALQMVPQAMSGAAAGPTGNGTGTGSGAMRPEDKHSEQAQRMIERVTKNLTGEARELTLRFLAQASPQSLDLLAFVDALDHHRRKSKIEPIGIAQLMHGFAVLQARGVAPELSEFLQQWHADWGQTQESFWQDWNAYLRATSGHLQGLLQNLWDAQTPPEEIKRVMVLLLWSMGEGLLPGQTRGWKETSQFLEPYTQAAKQMWLKLLSTEAAPSTP